MKISIIWTTKERSYASYNAKMIKYDREQLRMNKNE
jgi:hypothetical protein